MSQNRNVAVSTARLSSDPPWPCVSALLDERAEDRGTVDLFRFEGERLPFAAVRDLTESVAGGLLERGLRRGDRIALMLRNGLEFPVMWLAAARIGAVTVPINPRYQQEDLEYVLLNSGAKLIVADDEHISLIDRVRPACPAIVDVIEIATLDDVRALGADRAHLDGAVHPGDLMNLQYTSGTTGFPKACMLTHDYFLRMGWLAAGHMELGSDDVALTAQPFSYIDPQWNVLACMVAGIPLEILPRFSASGFWGSVRRAGATFFYVLGAMPTLLLKQEPNENDRENSVRVIYCSGIPRSRHAELEARWGAPWREAYGMTETGIDLIVGIDEEDSVGSGAIGSPAATKDVRIAGDDGVPHRRPNEPGEIVIKGLPMMRGYWRNPEATSAFLPPDGWARTGDLGHLDEQGRVYITGRIKDMVRRGGENIASAEVEAVLNEHPAVRTSALVPVEDETFGEEPKAFIQPLEGASPGRELAAEITDFAMRRLALFKVPRFVQFIDTFPLTPSHRIAKQKLLSADRSAAEYPEYDFREMLRLRPSDTATRKENSA